MSGTEPKAGRGMSLNLLSRMFVLFATITAASAASAAPPAASADISLVCKFEMTRNYSSVENADRTVTFQELDPPQKYNSLTQYLLFRRVGSEWKLFKSHWVDEKSEWNPLTPDDVESIAITDGSIDVTASSSRASKRSWSISRFTGKYLWETYRISEQIVIDEGRGECEPAAVRPTAKPRF